MDDYIVATDEYGMPVMWAGDAAVGSDASPVANDVETAGDSETMADETAPSDADTEGVGEQAPADDYASSENEPYVMEPTLTEREEVAGVDGEEGQDADDREQQEPSSLDGEVVQKNVDDSAANEADDSSQKDVEKQGEDEVGQELLEGPRELVFENETLKVTVNAQNNALPVGASLEVEEIRPDTYERAEAYAEALTSLTEELRKTDGVYTSPQVLDIRIM